MQGAEDPETNKPEDTVNVVWRQTGDVFKLQPPESSYLPHLSLERLCSVASCLHSSVLRPFRLHRHSAETCFLSPSASSEECGRGFYIVNLPPAAFKQEDVTPSRAGLQWMLGLGTALFILGFPVSRHAVQTASERAWGRQGGGWQKAGWISERSVRHVQFLENCSQSLLK